MRTYPRIPPQYLFFLSMRNTRVCAILQYCSIAVSAILPMCKYVQYTQYSDVSRPPGDDRYVYPSIVHSPPVELSDRTNRCVLSLNLPESPSLSDPIPL